MVAKLSSFEFIVSVSNITDYKRGLRAGEKHAAQDTQKRQSRHFKRCKH